MLPTRIILYFFLISFVSIPLGIGQSGKPVIIPDTDIAEGVDEKEEPKPKERNPDKAKENIDIGNFYNKRKNYVGAILRYLTALEYQPDSAKAYKSLVRAHESIVKAYDSKDRTKESLKEAEDRHGQISVAIDAFSDFLRNNPGWAKLDDFQKMIAKLEEVASRFDDP